MPDAATGTAAGPTAAPTTAPTTAPGERWAVYFAPPVRGPLWAFAARWLGRDAASGAEPGREGPLPAERLAAITAAPRRYGFHATLKPPFALAPGRDAAALHRAARRLAAGQRPFLAPPLELASLGGFLALTLSAPSPEMDALAAACVAGLDRFRAPPAPEELARRRAAGLTPEQEALLARWGYPHVMQAFRFHMTLTGRLEPAEREAVRTWLAPRLAPFCAAPLPVEAIALYRQPAPDAPFTLEATLPLGG